MIEIEKPRIETEELTEDGKYGKFVVEPLERGFGNTLGNSLRRVLLSSLEGCAVTSIKIDGVLHEFSTIPGVKEDVTEIVLNMKSLVAKLHETSPKVIEIAAEGPCEVKAADIKCDDEVEILNPDSILLHSVRVLSSIWKSQLTRAEDIFLQSATSS
jgi:DNA-directed RNA polymerase subunit alpha